MPIKTQGIAKLRRRINAGPREDVVQQQIMRSLRAEGYIVLSTSEHRRRTQCPGCRHWFTPMGGRGTDPGVPDLIVTLPAWRGLWVGLEIKSATGSLTPAQRELKGFGGIYICRSVLEALEAVKNAAEMITRDAPA